MERISPKIYIEGVEVDYLQGSYDYPGGFSAAGLTFSIPLTQGGMQKLWNKEVTLYLNKSDSYPLFRGWIKRLNETFDEIEIFAQDAVGYMVQAGGQARAIVELTNRDNLDGYTAGTFIQKIIERAKLDDKIKTTLIGDTSPPVNSVSQPFRGLTNVKSAIEEMVSKSINNSGDLPRPNILRVIDDGTYSQLVIELESDLDTAPIKHVYNTRDNITNLQVINKKVPTIIEVKGKKGVSGKFTHTSAIEAQDREYLSVSNGELESPAECREFAARLFQANLKAQYEYSLEVTEGAYLNENDVIRLDVEPSEFAGNYRVIGKTIVFDENSFRIGININKKPPTLAEYISSRDN